jgi:hypothetical protein
MRGVGQRGGDCASLDEVAVGVRCMWVELDGHRIDAIISATFTASVNPDDLASCHLTLDVLGPVELVYVNRDGDIIPGTEEIPADHAPILLGEMNHRTMVPRDPTSTTL